MATSYPRTDDPRPFGVDVSRYNTIDWATTANFAAPRVEFAMIRLGQAHRGAFDDVDRRFFYNTANAKAAGVPRMTYHVHYPASPPKPQVENVLRIGRLIGFDWGDDIYVGTTKSPRFFVDSELIQGMSGLAWIRSTWDFIQRLQDGLGEDVGDYTGKWLLDKYKVPPQDWYQDIFWWLAQYGNQNNPPPLGTKLAIPSGIPPERVLYWQDTSNLEGMLFGAAPGTRVDGNRKLGG